MAVPKKCPLCSAAPEAQTVVTRHVYGAKDARAFFRCAACDAIYLYPGLTPQEEHAFYSAEFESFMSSRSGASGGWTAPERHIAANQPTVDRRMKYLREVLPPRGRVLEFGCSSGFMMYPLIEQGYDCVGVEPSGVFRDYLSSRKVPCYESLHALSADSKVSKDFDVAMQFFVLEHVSDPVGFLRSQLEYVRPGGKLVFEIPNAADALVTVYDIPAFERFYWSIAHHWYFTEKALHHALGQLGLPFEIRLDQRYDLSNHMVWARDGKPGGMGRYTQALGVGLEESYKQALVRSGHCDTLIGVISK